ncbi:MAG: FAD-dependent oxidoreductase [Akkermansiaceae bacterium]|nr:FAD-dependent oxidoreductase [Akkermansiaceae bacterium]
MKLAGPFLIFLLILSAGPGAAAGHSIFLEAEAFDDRGGWKVDTQFVLNMGSPFLLAHGLGTPVADARTTIEIPEDGDYRIFVRTRDWVAPWNAPGTPGEFRLLIDGKALAPAFGTKGADWHWHDGGTAALRAGKHEVALRDLKGFGARCDAILFTSDPGFRPPDDPGKLPGFRRRMLELPEVPPTLGPYDLVVVGGGYSGLGAAISAARQGCRVALIQDRPVLGGNGSSEIRVWAKGGTRRGKYPRLGEIIEEFADHATDSPGRAPEFTDARKEEVVRAEKNLDLFLNHFAFMVETAENRITAVHAMETTSGARKRFTGKFFCDTTGHGTIGGLAGADYEMTEKGHMGMSNMWAWSHADTPVDWPETPWALPLKLGDFPELRESRGPGPKYYKGEWFWESGFDRHPLDDLEQIRDWNHRALFGAFTALKHGPEADKHRTARLQWVAYIGGNRESRRLMGDVVLSQEDVVGKRKFPDGCVPTTWDIDLHYPKEEFAKGPAKDNPFISRAEFGRHVDRRNGYPVPYRCFYSRNIDNLFMAGRCISVTHEALGTVRVMRTCGMMGEVVGKAAYLATVNNTTPRGVYQNYLPQLIELMKQPGVARRDSLDGALHIPEGAEPPPLKLEYISSEALEGIVIDDRRAKVQGKWTEGAGLKPFVDHGYRYAQAGKGVSATFTFRVRKSGPYELRYYYQGHENRAPDAVVEIVSAKGTDTLNLNLAKGPKPGAAKPYRSLGTFEFVDVLDGSLTVRGGRQRGNLHIDCVQLVPVK